MHCVMNIAEYLSSSHLDDVRYCSIISYAIRNLEQQAQLLKNVVSAENQFSLTYRSDEEFVQRFLMFGNTEGIYFARKKDFICTLVPGLCRIIQSGKGLVILRQILDFSESNRAPEKEPLLIALALCARYKVRDTQSKKKLPWDTMEENEKVLADAVCRDIRPVMEKTYQECLQKAALFAVHKVCIAPNHLFTFMSYCKVVSKASGLKRDTSGWGRMLRATVVKWYYNQTPSRLAVMVTKYRHRLGYSHRDLFCLSHIHPKRTFRPEHNYWRHQEEYKNIFKHVVSGHKSSAKEANKRKSRQELSAGDSKRSRFNSEETEQVQKNVYESNLEGASGSRAFGDVGTTAKPFIDATAYIDAFVRLQDLTSANLDEAVLLILQYGFEIEQVPQKFLSCKEIWGALLRRMSLRTMLENIDKMNGVDLFDEAPNGSVFNYLHDVLCSIPSFFYDNWGNYTDFTNDDPVSVIVRGLADTENLRQERFHPLAILSAKTKYEYGHGKKGNKIWKPIKLIQKAFDNAFYNCMNFIEPTCKRYLVAVDISDSMDGFVQGTTLACSQAAATLAMGLIKHEINVISLAFSDCLMPLEWDEFMSLSEYLTVAKQLRYGKTDCAQPIRWAIEHAIYVDVFIVLTDNDLSVKSMKPSHAIEWYRQTMDIPNAKLIVVGMTDKSGALANPDDPNMLVICGMNPSVPQIIRNFVML